MDYSALKKLLKGRVEFDHPIASETSYRLGGRVAVLTEPEEEQDAARLLRWAKEQGVRCLALGGGSNVLFSDDGFEGVVIQPGSSLRAVTISGDSVRAGAGAALTTVMNKAAEAGLGGLEFCAGIPGTIGGAVVGNAGGKEGAVGEWIEELMAVAPDGSPRRIDKSDYSYAYRSSSLQGSGLFLARVTLKLPLISSEEAKRKIRDYWQSRRDKQPLGKRNAGSVFKNPPGSFAGRLIEEVGLKGYRKGGAQVSEVHANFINHEEGGTAKDVVAVMREIQHRVFDTKGIRLEPEIIPLGDWKKEEAADVWWNIPSEQFR